MQARVDPNSLAIDGNSLNNLKNAKSDSPEAIREVARQFEGILMNMMLKSMRDTVPQDGVFDSEQSKMFTGMLDQQLTTKLSQKGMGLTDVLVRQLSKFSHKPAEQTDPAKTPAHGDNKNTLLNSLSSSNPDAGKVALMQATQKIRDTYQQWQATSPASDSTDNDAAWTRGIPELPPLLEAARDNVQNFTLPQTPLANAVRTVAGKTQQFIQQMLPHAQAASHDSGIPARFMLGQAALESGWGKHEIRTADGGNSHNLFGIKADAGWKGKVVNSTTTEYINGVRQTRVEKFRAYDSYSDAFRDYARLISQNPRYQQAMNSTHDASAYAHALQRAGYATDPQYGNKLTQVIKNLQG